MARIFRIMKRNGPLPLIGDGAMMLGVRPSDIEADEQAMVREGTGGMSVQDNINNIPAAMLPKRLRPLFPGARGSNVVVVWTMGSGAFQPDRVADHLKLAIDPDNATHGFVEPDAIMSFDVYSLALARTQGLWSVDEPEIP